MWRKSYLMLRFLFPCLTPAVGQYAVAQVEVGQSSSAEKPSTQETALNAAVESSRSDQARGQREYLRQHQSQVAADLEAQMRVVPAKSGERGSERMLFLMDQDRKVGRKKRELREIERLLAVAAAHVAQLESEEFKNYAEVLKIVADLQTQEVAMYRYKDQVFTDYLENRIDDEEARRKLAVVSIRLREIQSQAQVELEKKHEGTAAEAQQYLKELEGQISALETYKNHLQSLSSLKESVAAKENMILTLNQSVLALKKELEATREQLVLMQEDARKKEEHIVFLSQEIENAKTSASAQEQNIARLQAQLAAASKELAVSTYIVKEASNRFANLHKKSSAKYGFLRDFKDEELSWNPEEAAERARLILKDRGEPTNHEVSVP